MLHSVSWKWVNKPSPQSPGGDYTKEWIPGGKNHYGPSYTLCTTPFCTQAIAHGCVCSKQSWGMKWDLPLGQRAGLACCLLEKQWVPQTHCSSTACVASIWAPSHHPCGTWGQKWLMQIFWCSCFLCCAVSKKVLFLWLRCLVFSSSICETAPS